MSPDQPPLAGATSLAPRQVRIMDHWSYLLAWLGGCVSIGTFAMGASLVGQLSGPQAALAMALGCLVIALALTLNGAAGHRYGIPFMVQARPAVRRWRVDPVVSGAWCVRCPRWSGTAFKAGWEPLRSTRPG